MASIFDTSGGSGSGSGSVTGSGTANRLAFWSGSVGSSSTDLTFDSLLAWIVATKRLAIGGPNTISSLVTLCAQGVTDATSSFEVRTSLLLGGDVPIFRIFDNGRTDSRMLNNLGQVTQNVSFGHDAGRDLSSGDQNSFFGWGAGRQSTTQIGLAFFGTQSGLINTGDFNSFFGSFSGAINTTGAENTFVGFQAGVNASTGSQNVLIGANSGFAQTAAAANTLVGYYSGGGLTTGSNNIMLGHETGRRRLGPGNPAATLLDTCIFIGNGIDALTNSDTNAISIGHFTTSYGSNTCAIGNSSMTDTFLFGNMNLTDGAIFRLGTGTGTEFGDTASEKLSFWGKTPNVQPTTAIASATFASPGSGTNLKTDDTFDGYTLGKVVAALRRVGILA